MSNAAIQRLDQRIHRRMARAGMADHCTFIPLQGVPVEGAKCFVDRDVALQTMRGVEFRRGAALVILLREGIASTPVRGDLVQLVSSRFKVVSVLDPDEEGAWRLECETL